MRLMPLLLLLSTLSGACSHTQDKAVRVESLRTVVEGFHQRVRWKDYRTAARFIVPERRQDFERARRELNDERDLSITDYEVEDVSLSEDGLRATITSRFQWMRLPSVTEQSATVISEFVWREGGWLLERQEQGPFAGELP